MHGVASARVASCLTAGCSTSARATEATRVNLALQGSRRGQSAHKRKLHCLERSANTELSRASVVARAQATYQGGNAAVMEAKFQQWRQEYEGLMTTFCNLTLLEGTFWSFDVAGKHIYIDQMEQLWQDWCGFNDRLKTASATDEAAWRYTEMLSGQLAQQGINVDQLHDSASMKIKVLRQLTDLEEKAMRDPVELAQVRQLIREDMELAQQCTASM